ncbi:uncharacterized protein LOC111393648 [Olea europaea var. sylvestris]|uniref:uncharacterized protein LOC111393648 n=1 Tax=Olea europaea var. sylvestris TaxID=158386 RepID=UPI000C1D1DD5|nr:uncharacterized protein LOC111393648 [Olea europaea var. sylvestris]
MKILEINWTFSLIFIANFSAVFVVFCRHFYFVFVYHILFDTIVICDKLCNGEIRLAVRKAKKEKKANDPNWPKRSPSAFFVFMLEGLMSSRSQSLRLAVMRTMRTVETMKTMSKHHHRKLDFGFKRGNKRLFLGKKRRREETHSLVFIIVTRRI